MCAGNVEGDYKRSEIDSMLKTEFISALQPAFARISELEVRPSALPAHAEELSTFMNETLSRKWGELRGLQVVSIAMNPISLPEEDADSSSRHSARPCCAIRPWRLPRSRVHRPRP